SMAAHDSRIERDRQRFADERIGTLRRRVFEHQPTFVVMYGKKNWPEYERISKLKFSGAPDVGHIGQTAVLFTQHPRWWSNDDAECYAALLSGAALHLEQTTH